MKPKKFLIINNDIRMGRVWLHKDLVSSEEEDIKGGGLFHIDTEKKIIYFYGESFDYGRFELENLKIIFNNKESRIHRKLKGYVWVYSDKDYLSEALLSEIKLNNNE